MTRLRAIWVFWCMSWCLFWVLHTNPNESILHFTVPWLFTILSLLAILIPVGKFKEERQ